MMHFVKFCRTAITPALIFACVHSARAEQDKIAPCREDAMIVFDASGSMSGNQTLGVPANAGAIIMREVYALVPAGKTPLTSAVEQAAQALDYRNKPGVVVVVTDGEETCGRSPCDLAKQLQDAARQLTIHVISFRYQSYSWTGEQSIEETKCLAKQNGGLFITVDTEQDLTAALEKTLDCPMISQQVP
jgi:Ca-activated chloride channel family protein